MRLVQGMYANARSRVRVGEGYSEEFEVKVGAQPTALHHCACSLITRVPLWGPLGGPLCR